MIYLPNPLLWLSTFTMQVQFQVSNLKKKQTNNQPTPSPLPLTMNYRSLFSMSHPLACWEHSSYMSSEIKTV